MPGNSPGLPKVVDDPGQQAAAADLPQASPPASIAPAAPTNAHSAQDADIIEAAWLHRVEQLFHEYGDDPQKLSDQFTHLKMEYIAKRYGKQIGKGHAQD
jgi:hypothetical protein